MSKMMVNPRAAGVHRCSYADECGKPTTRRDRQIEKRAIRARERRTWTQDGDRR